MTLKIDFYLAQDVYFEQCKELCIKLLTSEYQAGHDISILFNTLDNARWLDCALWSHNPSSFMPHTLDQNKNIIKITRPENPNTLTQCNMQLTEVALLNHVQHLIQIVPNNESDKQTARQWYQHYKQLGHPITVHKDT